MSDALEEGLKLAIRFGTKQALLKLKKRLLHPPRFPEEVVGVDRAISLIDKAIEENGIPLYGDEG